MSDMIQRMRDAGVPPQAYGTTLEREGQTLLRSVITDKAYVSNKLRNSFMVTYRVADFSPTRVSTIFARFAAELVAIGLQVAYVRTAAIVRELDKLSYGSQNEVINPVLTNLGRGFILVPDLFDVAEVIGGSFWGVADILMDHVTRGGGLILLGSDRSDTEPLPADFLAMADTFTKLQLRKVAANV